VEVLELAILGLLKEQELHGYELKKRLADTFGGLSRVSFGSLYPALRRLERAGAVEVVVVGARAAAPIPTTGSLAGELAAFRARHYPGRDTRGRKVYCITPTGQSLFEQLLGGDADDDDRAFSLKLAFARHLAAEARLGLLHRRRAQLVERLKLARAACRTGLETRDRYSRSIAEHTTESTEHDISWIDRLIEAERDELAPAAPAASAVGDHLSAGADQMEGIDR
jgi:DNA-binding PadR family transcriptional regulator